MRQLEFTLIDGHVGSLIDQNGVWALKYSPDWLRSPRPLASATALRV